MRSIDLQIAENGIATLTLNRPEALNALNLDLVKTLRGDLAELATNPQVKAVIVTGAGRAFCAGADLAAMEIKPDADGHVDMGRIVSDLMTGEFGPLVVELMNFPKPVVSAINGMAVGGGVGLALCADVVIGSREAKLKIVQCQILVAIADLGATWFIQRTAGRAAALSMSLLGESLDADRLERLGLVWEIVEADQLKAKAEAVAASLAAVPPESVLATRRMADMAATAPFAAMMEQERLYLRDLATLPFLKARIAAFKSKK